MLPVVSTRPLSNFELTLSPDGTRVGHHRCSNLLDYTEVKTRHGFLTDATKNPEVIGDTAPYQYSASLRGPSALRFYRNLNLEACLWEFTSYYDMSELLSDCGGTIGTDGQVSSPSSEQSLNMESTSLAKERNHSQIRMWAMYKIHPDLQSQLTIYDRSTRGVAPWFSSKLQ